MSASPSLSDAVRARSRNPTWSSRLKVVVDAIQERDRIAPPDDPAAVLAGLPHDPELAWLFLAVWGVGLPSEEEVREFQRSCTLDGVSHVLLRMPGDFGRVIRKAPRVLSGDLWIENQSAPELPWGVGADPDRVLTWTRGGGLVTRAGERVVPWMSRCVMLGIQPESRRAEALTAAARYSRSATVAVGHDGTELATRGCDAAGFATSLTSLQRVGVICAADGESLAHMTAWASVLPGIGIKAPRVVVVARPTSTMPDDWRAYARRLAAEALPSA
jgi:hypothetical protein